MNATPALSKRDSNKLLWQKLSVDLINAFVIAFPDYIAEPREDYGITFKYKLCPDNISIFIRHDDWNGKLEVSECFKHKGSYFRWEDYFRDIEAPSCGFSNNRPVSVIISGIEKRFMPNFNLIIDKAVALWAQWEKRDNNKNAAHEEICAALDIKPRANPNNTVLVNGEYSETIWPESNSKLRSIISSVRVSSADYINIELSSMSKEQAIKLINLLKANF